MPETPEDDFHPCSECVHNTQPDTETNDPVTWPTTCQICVQWDGPDLFEPKIKETKP